MTKILITGGCSFSECASDFIDTWPRHLARLLPEYNHVSTAMSSQGNGLISRKIIYEIQHQIKQGVDPKDIVVGIMWSGPDRHDIYIDTNPIGYSDNSGGWYENPTKFVKNQPIKNWYVFNSWWQNISLNKTYYKLFHNETMHLILTYEHILRVQWFLKSLGIKYFMTCYMDTLFHSEQIKHPELKYLYDMIDLTTFLPVTGEYEWCKEKSSFDFPIKDDPHPGNDQHKEFTEKVVFPFLLLNRMV